MNDAQRNRIRRNMTAYTTGEGKTHITMAQGIRGGAIQCTIDGILEANATLICESLDEAGQGGTRRERANRIKDAIMRRANG